jgi:hypothetical protein
MTFGFSVVFVVAMCIYLCALLVLRTMLRAESRPDGDDEIVLDGDATDPVEDPLPV